MPKSAPKSRRQSVSVERRPGAKPTEGTRPVGEAGLTPSTWAQIRDAIDELIRSDGGSESGSDTSPAS